MKLELPPLYPITDRSNRPGWPHRRLAHCYLEAGIRFFQVRDKQLPDRELLHELLMIRESCDRFGARFIVNDRVDLALACRADGVHLGQDDLPPSTARRLLGSEGIVGISTHDAAQFKRALSEPVDYVALGPVFATGSKPDASPVVGPKAFGELATLSRLPVVAIGGISLETAPLLWGRGAAAVAVISDVNRQIDPGQRIREYLLNAKSCCP